MDMGKILKWPILYIVVQFGLIFLCAFLFIGFENNINDFAPFLAKYRIILVLTLGLIFIPLLVKDFQKEKMIVEKLNAKDIMFIILIGSILSVLYNTLVYYFNQVFDFTNLFSENTFLWQTMISVGIIGPILEEYMFRGVMYRDLKKQYSNIKSILICTTIFALLHFTSIQMLYAFAFGFMLIFSYERYRNIAAPIILHMASNLTTIFWTNILIQNYFLLNYSVYLIALIILIVVFGRLKKIWYNANR